MASLQELARADNWWDYKVPPILAVGFAAALVYDVPLAGMVEALGLILALCLSAGAYGHFINDATDVEADRKAGKPNQMARFPAWARAGICLGTLALGLLPAAVLPYSTLSLILLGLEFLAPSLYSIPPFRLKERGILGLLADALGAHVIPMLFAVSVMVDRGAPVDGPDAALAWLFPPAILAWALCVGLKGILVHEYEDRANDLRSGLTTFATAGDLPRVDRALERMWRLELAAFGGLLLVLAPWAPIMPLAALAYAGVAADRIVHHWNCHVHSPDEEPKLSRWQSGHLFYECALPFLLAVTLAWRDPALAWLPVVLVLAFRRNFLVRIGELREFLPHLRTWILWRGRLHLNPGAGARLYRLRPYGRRLLIWSAGTKPSDVRLVRACAPVQAGRRFRVRLGMRATAPRQVTLGLWHDHPPWTSLGLQQVVQLTERWVRIEAEFTATGNCDRPCFGVWLGGNATAVEIHDLSIAPLEQPSGRAEPCRIHLADMADAA